MLRRSFNAFYFYKNRLFVTSLKRPRSQEVKRQVLVTRDKGEVKQVSVDSPDPRILGRDWVGPPHKISRICEVKFYIPDDELPSEQRFRLLREEVQAWNQDYWYSHNLSFEKLREDYMERRLKEVQQEDPERQTLTAEEMSEFYKKFLEDNHRKHIKYNKDWYKKNFGLLWPALKASLSRVYLRTLKKSEG